MKKAVLAILICFALVFSSGCLKIRKITETTESAKPTDNVTTSGSASAESSSAGPTSASPATTSLAGESGVIGDFVVEYLGYQLLTDYEDAPAIAIYYNFTNNSAEAANFNWSILQQVYQDGVELESDYVSETITEFDNGYTDIKPGISLDVCSIYQLRSLESDVEVDLSDYTYNSEDRSSGVIVISTSRTEPTTTAPVQTPSNLGDYNVEIIGHEIIQDYEDLPALVVYFRFTNSSETANSFFWAITTELYQDGVGLESTYLNEDLQEYINSSLDIKPGVSLDCCLIYRLRNETSPVELEAYEFYTGEQDKLTETIALP